MTVGCTTQKSSCRKMYNNFSVFIIRWLSFLKVGIIFLQYKTKMLSNSSTDVFYFLSIGNWQVKLNLVPGYQCRPTLTSKITVEKSHVYIFPTYFVILEFCSLRYFMPLANILNVFHLSLCLQQYYSYS